MSGNGVWGAGGSRLRCRCVRVVVSFWLCATACCSGYESSAICEAGSAKSCQCSDGRAGAQTCEHDGSTWLPCVCQSSQVDDDATAEVAACQPDCGGGKECGTDGCGGVCGTCSGDYEYCDQGTCTCDDDCSGKQCGTNACGKSCGSCRHYFASWWQQDLVECDDYTYDGLPGPSDTEAPSSPFCVCSQGYCQVNDNYDCKITDEFIYIQDQSSHNYRTDGNVYCGNIHYTNEGCEDLICVADVGAWVTVDLAVDPGADFFKLAFMSSTGLNGQHDYTARINGNETTIVYTNNGQCNWGTSTPIAETKWFDSGTISLGITQNADYNEVYSQLIGVRTLSCRFLDQ